MTFRSTLLIETYARTKKILINWILENMKDPNVQICALIESKNE